MARTPFWKVYDAHGQYQASCHEPEAAAALMGLYGDGATIRMGTDRTRAGIVWTEGAGGAEAGESYDYVAAVCRARIAKRRDEFNVRFGLTS